MITGKHKLEMATMRDQLYDAYKAVERLNATILAMRANHDAELSAALAGKIDAEAELSRLRGGFCAEPSEPQPVAGAAGKLPKKSKSKKD